MTMLELEELLHDMVESVLSYSRDKSPENFDALLMTARHSSQEFALHIKELDEMMDEMEDENASR